MTADNQIEKALKSQTVYSFERGRFPINNDDAQHLAEVIEPIIKAYEGDAYNDGHTNGYADCKLEVEGAHAAGVAEGVAKVKSAVESSLVNEPICDLYPNDDPATCGWKRSVQCVVSALASVEGGAS